jgi:hypothetical protein
LYFHIQTDSRFLSGSGLLALVVVVIGNQGNHETEFFHGNSAN